MSPHLRAYRYVMVRDLSPLMGGRLDHLPSAYVGAGRAQDGPAGIPGEAGPCAAQKEERGTSMIQDEDCKRELILNCMDDMVADFLYYDRKEDEDLPMGEIQRVILEGCVTQEEIVERFAARLKRGIEEGR